MRVERAITGFGQKIVGTIWERAVLAKLCHLLSGLLAGAFGIYCLADLILNQRALSELTPYYLLEHYACHIVKRLPRILPICTLLCSLRLLANTMRSGEWTALQSSGISLRQISAPFARFGCISCFWGIVAFEALYPLVANSLRFFEERPLPPLTSPHILFLKQDARKLSSCLVFWSYRDCAQSDSSGVFRRGFFCPEPGTWIGFETLQFFPGCAQLRQAIKISFEGEKTEASRAKTLLFPYDIDLATLIRQTTPAEDLSLRQLKKEQGRAPRNSIAGAYLQYRLLQLLTPLWSVYLALALFIKSNKKLGLGSAVLGILVLVGLDALCQIGVILSGFHLLRPFWLWLAFLPPLLLWFKGVYRS